MFIQIKRFLKRLNKLEVKDWRILCLLMGGAFVLGQFMVYLNTGVMDLYLQKGGIFDIGFDFLWVGILISFVGRITVKLDRRRGYGGAPLTLILFGLLAGLLWWIQEVSESQLIPHLFFLYAYTAPLLLQYAFWMVAHRFIPLRMDSYKFLGVFAWTLLGMIYGASKIAKGHFDSLSVLMMALTCLGVLFALMKLLVWFLPVPSETFVKKSGGVQDVTESKLVACILCMALLFTSVNGLMDYLLYQTLLGRNILVSLSNLWFAKAVLGLLILASCYRISYIYQVVGASLLLCMTFALSGLFFVMDTVFWVWVAVVLTGSLTYLYWGTLLQILPRILILGQGLRIRFLRDVLCVPLGWILAGSLILTFSSMIISQILILFSCGLLFCILMALCFYNRFFIQMCRIRRWCSGPMMLLSKKAKDFLIKGVRSDDLNEVLYFFRLMEQAGYSGYKDQLVKGLKHSLFEIRLFCVDKLDKIGVEPFMYRQLSQLFHTEKNDVVKARILAALIHREGEENISKIFHKFGSYLDDKKLRSGAILGFLQTGGECALLAMDGLQHLSQSKKKEDIFQALDIIEHVPQTGLIRLVLPLLKHENKEVVKRAIETAGHIGHTQSLSFILSSLDVPELQEVSLRALKMYDKLALPPIEKMITNVHVPMARRKKLILFLACLPSGEGKQILLRLLNIPDQKLRKDILKALLDSKIVWASRPRKRFLLPALMKDIEHWNWLKENIQKCSQAPDTSLADSFGFLMRSFQETQKDLRTIILYQLLLLYPNVLVEKAIQMIGRTQITQQINGIDILQDLISAKLYHPLRPTLLDPIESDESTLSEALNKTQACSFLEHLILKPEFELDRWASACALYGLKSAGEKTNLNVLKRAFSMPWEIVWEAALDDLEAWMDKKEIHHFLQTILSDMPNQGFVHYLKTRRANDYV